MPPRSTYWSCTLILSPIYSWKLQVIFFPQVSPTKSCMHLSCLLSPHVLHAPPTSFFFISSPEFHLVRSTEHKAPKVLRIYIYTNKIRFKKGGENREKNENKIWKDTQKVNKNKVINKNYLLCSLHYIKRSIESRDQSQSSSYFRQSGTAIDRPPVFRFPPLLPTVPPWTADRRREAPQ